MTRVGHLVREDGCWIWRGSKNAKGYGRCWGGMAHRRYYEEAHGPIPEGLELDHLCRNRACVNPDHLEPVTHAENMRRGYAVSAKATPDGLPAMIRSARSAAGMSQNDLAARLGCSQALVNLWERGRHDVTDQWLTELGRVLEFGGVRA